MSRLNRRHLAVLLMSICLAALTAAWQVGRESPLQLRAGLDGRTLIVDWGASLPEHAELSLNVWHVSLVTPEGQADRLQVIRTVVLGIDDGRQAFDLAGWPVGDVHVNLVLHPIAQVDPDVVRAVGIHGERLVGPQVIEDLHDDQRYLEAVAVVTAR